MLYILWLISLPAMTLISQLILKKKYNVKFDFLSGFVVFITYLISQLISFPIEKFFQNSIYGQNFNMNNIKYYLFGILISFIISLLIGWVFIYIITDKKFNFKQSFIIIFIISSISHIFLFFHKYFIIDFLETLQKAG
jgi:hypothetical protein